MSSENRNSYSKAAVPYKRDRLELRHTHTWGLLQRPLIGLVPTPAPCATHPLISSVLRHTLPHLPIPLSPFKLALQYLRIPQSIQHSEF